MPLHKNLTISNVDVPAQAPNAPEPIQVQEEERYRLYAIPVADHLETIDLSFLDNKKDLVIEIPKRQMSDIRVVVADGTYVTGSDPYKTRARILVETPSGKHFKARDYIYAANQDKTTINCEMVADKPITKAMAIPYKKLSEQMDTPGFEDIAKGVISCRHLTTHSIEARRKAKEQGVSWQETISHDFSTEVIKKTFANMLEKELNWLDMYQLSGEIYRVPHLDDLPASCGALLKSMYQNLEEAQCPPGFTLNRSFVLSMASETEAHAVQVELSVRKEEDGEHTYKVKIFDPNMSYTHRSYATKDVYSVGHQEVFDLFGPLFCNYMDLNDKIELCEVAPDWGSKLHEEQNKSQGFYELKLYREKNEPQEELIGGKWLQGVTKIRGSSLD